MAAGLIALAAVAAVAVATGSAWQRTNGRIRGRGTRSGPGAAGLLISSAEVGVPLGERATLVQFFTAFCAPCRATRRILGEVAGMTEGVAHVDIDAESHLDLVRRLDIRRTPTVLVVGPDGRIAGRASGQPRKADVIAALDQVSWARYSYCSDRGGGKLMVPASVTRQALPMLFSPTLTTLGRSALTGLAHSGLTKRRAVDFCRVATAQCRPVRGRSEPAAPSPSGAASC